MTPTIESASGVEVVLRGRRLVSFAGCDYLGLARHPDVVAAAREALERCGVGAAASRTTTGTWTPHAELERALAAWFAEDDAVLLASGYAAPAALAVALADEADVVLLDAGAHPAVADAATLSRLPVRRFAHFDAKDAAHQSDGAGRPLILTVPSGDPEPLCALARLAGRRGGHLVVDDAHGIGVLGPRGRGAAAGLGPRVHVAGSLSKALGAHGGFVTGTQELCDRVRTRFDAYAGATPIPPSTAAAATVAVRLASRGDALRRRLRANAALLAKRLRAMGIATPRPGIPWFWVSGRTARELRAISAALRRDGLLVPHVTYFGAPPRGSLRIAVTAAHTREHVERLADALTVHLGASDGSPRVPR